MVGVTSRANRAALLKHLMGGVSIDDRGRVTSRANRAALLKLAFNDRLEKLIGEVTSRANRAALLKRWKPRRSMMRWRRSPAAPTARPY